MTDQAAMQPSPNPAAARPRREPPKRAMDHPPETGKLREIFDELVFVFVIVMFMKMFLVELYKIPTGSMTPELLGGLVAQVDANNDGKEDLLYWETESLDVLGSGQTFLNDGKRRVLRPEMAPSRQEGDALQRAGKIEAIYDRILVNKVVYWFKPARRGDVVVFKVPDPPFRPEAPIYIKRLVGEPGDRLSFIPDPSSGGSLAYLAVNGKQADTPDFFKIWRYRPLVEKAQPGRLDLPYVKYFDRIDGTRLIESIDVPKDQAFVFGDNTAGSLDSRYWGGVPLENLKGRAFMKVWPLHRLGFIH